MDDRRIATHQNNSPDVIHSTTIDAYAARIIAIRAALDEVVPDVRDRERWEVACPVVQLVEITPGALVYRAQVVAHRPWTLFRRAVDEEINIDIDPSSGSVVGIESVLDPEE